LVMKYIAAAIVVLASLCASAEVRKSCEELKAEITKKIEANKVSSYWLEIVDKGKQKDGAVVGSCDGGTKVIVYHRGAPPEQPDSKAPAQTKPE
jgi:hypothetical protein